MKKISVVGCVDKRFVVYPLIHVLSLLGRVAIITDDTSFQRFGDGQEYDIEVGTALIYIRTGLTEESIEEILLEAGEPFDYLLVIANTFVYPQASVIHLASITKGFENFPYVTSEDLSEKEDIKKVYLTASKPKNLEGLKIVISPKLLAYVYACEDSRRFFPMNDSGVVGMLATLFGDRIDTPAKTLVKMMVRRS